MRMHLTLMGGGASRGLPRNGLVALYDPYRDTYGRNVLPVGSADFSTGWHAASGATASVTPGQADPDGGNNAYRLQASGGTKQYKYYSGGFIQASGVRINTACYIRNRGGKSVKLTDNALTGSVEVTIPAESGWTKAEISGVADGVKCVQIIFYAETVDDAIDCDVYHPQHNLGPTLFPYSAPSGAPGTLQTATDYSGRGNHLTLGATTGVSTDDPAYTGTAWSFDGGDYLLGPTAAMYSNTAGMTVISVYTPPVGSTTGLAGQYSGETSKRCWYLFGNSGPNFTTQQNPASPNADMVATLSAHPTAGQTHFVAGRWLPSVRTQIIRGNFADQAVATTAAASMNSTPPAFEIGRYNQGTAYEAKGTLIRLTAIYNRYLVDAEISRAYRYLKSLMAGRGVTVA